MSKEWIEIPLSVTDKIGQWAIWAGVKLLVIVPGVGIYTWKQLSRLSLHLAIQCERFYCKLVVPLDSLPYGGMEGSKLIEVEAHSVGTIEPISDFIAAIEDKELQIIGEKGTGKSTLAQYLAYTLGGYIRVFEPEGTPDDWTGLDCIGKGEDWEAINSAMEADLEHLSSQLKIRRERGDSALAGSDRVIIGEEYPDVAAKCDASEEWLDRHARRGRKARVRLILLSQYDRAAAWGMEGKLDLLDCFYRLRLGRKAVNHAQKLKRDDLVEWLRQSRGHALLDDTPITLPDYREMQRVIQMAARGYGGISPQLPPSYQAATQNLGEVPLEPLQHQGIEPIEVGVEESPEALLDKILDAIADDRSDDWITKQIGGKTGGSGYYAFKERVAKIRGRVGR